MGRALVEPVDDLRATNPATHPELLNRLATEFRRRGYDLRGLIRSIANSAAFGRASSDGAAMSGGAYYERRISERLLPEVLADAISDVTGEPGRYGDEPPGRRAIELAHAGIPATALDLLGRCSRRASCSDVTSSPGLAATLHLLNGPFFNERISSSVSGGHLAASLANGASDREIVAEFYFRALSRPPRTDELRFWLNELTLDAARTANRVGSRTARSATVRGNERAVASAAAPKGRREIFEDFLWSLLNSREFTTNH